MFDSFPFLPLFPCAEKQQPTLIFRSSIPTCLSVSLIIYYLRSAFDTRATHTTTATTTVSLRREHEILHYSTTPCWHFFHQLLSSRRPNSSTTENSEVSEWVKEWEKRERETEKRKNERKDRKSHFSFSSTPHHRPPKVQRKTTIVVGALGLHSTITLEPRNMSSFLCARKGIENPTPKEKRGHRVIIVVTYMKGIAYTVPNAQLKKTCRLIQGLTTSICLLTFS